MAQATGKQVGHYLRLDSSKEYQTLVESRYPDLENGKSIQVIQGGTPELQGTWGHRKVALHFAQWCNPEFALQVTEWIEELLLTGKVELQPETLKLPPADIRVVNLANTIAAFDIDIKNPRFKQGLQDVVLNILGVGQSPSGTTEIWLGVAERAEQLGYPIGLVTKHRSQLGKWVAKHEMTCKREKRLCNGTQREINVYLVTDELDDCIKEYLDVKMLSPVD
jgi:hypothetical protein